MNSNYIYNSHPLLLLLLFGFAYRRIAKRCSKQGGQGSVTEKIFYDDSVFKEVKERTKTRSNRGAHGLILLPRPLPPLPQIMYDNRKYIIRLLREDEVGEVARYHCKVRLKVTQ